MYPTYQYFRLSGFFHLPLSARQHHESHHQPAYLLWKLPDLHPIRLIVAVMEMKQTSSHDSWNNRIPRLAVLIALLLSMSSNIHKFEKTTDNSTDICISLASPVVVDVFSFVQSCSISPIVEMKHFAHRHAPTAPATFPLVTAILRSKRIAG